METVNARGYIIVINSKRKRVKIEDYNKSQKINEDKVNLNGFKYDLAWDLSHGFTEANKAFDNIENSDVRTVLNENIQKSGYMAIEEAKQLTIEKIKKINHQNNLL